MRTLRKLTAALDLERERQERFERMTAEFWDKVNATKIRGNIYIQAVPVATILEYSNPVETVDGIRDEIVRKAIDSGTTVDGWCEGHIFDDRMEELTLTVEYVRRLIREMSDKILAPRIEQWFDTEFLPDCTARLME